MAQTVPKHIVTLDFYQPVYRSQLENYHLSEEHFPNKNEIILAVNQSNAHAQYVYKTCGFQDKGLRTVGRKGEQLILHLELGSG